MYQILEKDVKLAPGLALDVTMDRTIRFIRFNLPERAPAIPFNRSGSASYAPSRAEISQHIHDDGTEEIKVDFFSTLNSSTTLKSTWINRKHPERENPFSEETDSFGIIEDLPEELRVSLRRAIYGEPKVEPDVSELKPARAAAALESAERSAEEKRHENMLDKVHIVRSGFKAGNIYHSKVLYLPELKIGGTVRSGVYLVREFSGGESYTYSIYDENGGGIGAIFESVDGLGDEYLTGKDGMIAQFEALQLINRTGYNSPVGRVVQSRGPLRTLTGYGF